MLNYIVGDTDKCVGEYIGVERRMREQSRRMHLGLRTRLFHVHGSCTSINLDDFAKVRALLIREVEIVTTPNIRILGRV